MKFLFYFALGCLFAGPLSCWWTYQSIQPELEVDYTVYSFDNADTYCVNHWTNGQYTIDEIYLIELAEKWVRFDEREFIGHWVGHTFFCNNGDTVRVDPDTGSLVWSGFTTHIYYKA